MNTVSKTLILASSSPRRKEILLKAGFNFKIVPSSYDEKIAHLAYDKNLVINCAYNKGLEVFKKYPNDIIISSDTVVVSDNIILGKPKDEKDAFETLKSLSDKTHFVASAICLISKEKTLKDIDITYVTFKKLTDDDILNYIKKSKPFDKAGSYGIQDDGFDFAINLKGSKENVMGFPIELFKKMLTN